jgi:hypothetical protein
MIEIPNLTIDRNGTDPDTQVMLTQDFGGNEHMVTLHPCQVQLLAERMGLLVPDVESQRTIARLCRQMRILLDRIDQLDDDINRVVQGGHVDLETEMTFSFATWQLANEFCKDLPDAGPAHHPATPVSREMPATAKPAPPSTIATAAGGGDKTNAERQQRNGAAVTGVTDADRNAITPNLI